MIYRFYDIVAESEAGDYKLDKEFTLEVPDHDLSTAIERQEHLASMFDVLVSASGCQISSFCSDAVTA